jgi:hypothetical protein
MKFPQRSDVPSNDILRLILRGHMNDVRDFVRFPALEEILASKTHALLRTFSPTQLRLTRECLEIAVESIEANRESFFHRHHGTWLMARTCIKSSLVLLAMAMRCQAEARSTGVMATELEEMMLPSRWREVVEQTVEALQSVCALFHTKFTFWGEPRAETCHKSFPRNLQQCKLPKQLPGFLLALALSLFNKTNLQ